MVNLIFLDLDGTLIGASGAVRPAVWEATDRLVALGCTLCVCTGRPDGGVARAVVERLGPDQGPHIFQGGALIRQASGEILQAMALPLHGVRSMVAHARAQGLTLELYTEGEIFVDRHTDNALRHTALLGLPPQTVTDLEALAQDATILKTQWIVSHPQAQLLLSQEVPGCFQAVGLSDGMPDVTFISVTSALVNKGQAVRAVMKARGVSASACAAVGDTMGDVPMLEAVEYPFVMANSQNELFLKYPAVLPSVEADGIGALVDRLEALNRNQGG